MSYLDVRTKLAPVVTWRCDDASTGLTASTGGGDNLGILGAGHTYSQTGLVPELVGISTSVKNGTLATAGWYNGTTTTANTLPTTVRSVEAWFHVDDVLVSPNMYLVGRSTASDTNGHYAVTIEYVSTTVGKIKAFWSTGSGDKSSITNINLIANQTTHHVVCTYVTGASGISIYVDGRQAATTDGTDAEVGTDLNRMAIGIATTGARGAALTRIDEVSVYNKTLSASDVKSLYSGFSWMRNRFTRGIRRPSLVR